MGSCQLEGKGGAGLSREEKRQIMIERREETSRNYDVIEQAAGRTARDMMNVAVSDFNSSAYASFVVETVADLAGRADGSAVLQAAFALSRLSEIGEERTVVLARKVGKAVTEEDLMELLRPYTLPRDVGPHE